MHHIQVVKQYKMKGKETTTCDKICSFIASTSFGHQTCPSSGVQLVTSAFRATFSEQCTLLAAQHYTTQAAFQVWPPKS
jgi:hypothetical protein